MYRNKVLILILVITSCIQTISLTSLFAFSQQRVKKVVADVTEYYNKDKIIKFTNNVKIELTNGKIFCDIATYNETGKIFRCESNVYAIIISTEDNSTIEIFSNFATYDQMVGKLEFFGDPYAIYKSSCGVEVYKLKSKEILVKEKEDKVVCQKDVFLTNSDGEVSCDIAEYFVLEKKVYMNYQPFMLNNRVVFNSKNKSLNIKTFSSNYAIFDVQKNEINLYGNVEIIFQANDNNL